MESKEIFEKHRSRLEQEGILKSFLCGLTVGFAVATIMAVAFWLADIREFWAAIIVGVALTGGLTPLFYFKKFKPSDVAVAQRLDLLGLEERIVTMNELKNDDSYIAKRQRQDAKEALERVANEKLSLHIPLKITVASLVVAIVYLLPLTLGALTYAGYVPPAKEIGEVLGGKQTVYHEVSYLCEGDGYIEGDEVQVVADGESATTVVAVAEDGWYFAGWIDARWLIEPDKYELDSDQPERTDENVIENIEMLAVFVEMEESEGDGDGDGAAGEPGDEEGDPSDTGEPGDPSDSQEPNDGDAAPDGEGGGAGTGDDIQDNTFLDGQTPLKDYYDEYYDQAKQLLEQGKDLPDDLREIIEGYYGGL